MPTDPGRSAVPSPSGCGPESGGALEDRRFYSWRDPLSLNWDSEAGLLPGSQHFQGTGTPQASSCCPDVARLGQALRAPACG